MGAVHQELLDGYVALFVAALQTYSKLTEAELRRPGRRGGGAVGRYGPQAGE